jgi:hypothetical protein
MDLILSRKTSKGENCPTSSLSRSGPETSFEQPVGIWIRGAHLEGFIWKLAEFHE